MRMTILKEISVAGVLGCVAAIIAWVFVAGALSCGAAHAQGFVPRRPTTGDRITAEANAKAAMRAVARQELAAQQQRSRNQRSYGGQDFYKGPKGDVINGRDLPPGAQSKGYRFQGSRDFGQPQQWQNQNWGRPFRPQ